MSKTRSAWIVSVVPTTVSVGSRSGTTIVQTTRSSLAPSTRAASNSSAAIDLRLAEMIVIANPVAVQMPTKMRAKLFVVESMSQATGSNPAVPMRALSVPVCLVPGGSYWYMNFQMIEEATALIG